jgi:TRAP-type transport system periplasmic protein
MAKIRTNRNPVARATFEALGFDEDKRHVCEIEDLKQHIEEGQCDAGETVYSRIYPLDQNEVSKAVLDTEHSLFLTAMIMRNDFWEKLSPEVRAVLKDAALKAGRKERETTIMDGQEAKQRLIAEGVEIHTPTAEEKQEMKEKTKVVYEKFKDTFSPGLVDRIKKA